MSSETTADEGQAPDWSPGVEISVPLLRSQAQKIVGGEISQLVQHETSAKVVSWGKDNGLLAYEDGSEIEVRLSCARFGEQCQGLVILSWRDISALGIFVLCKRRA